MITKTVTPPDTYDPKRGKTVPVEGLTNSTCHAPLGMSLSFASPYPRVAPLALRTSSIEYAYTSNLLGVVRWLRA